MEDAETERPPRDQPNPESQSELANLQDLPKAPVYLEAKLDPETQIKPLIASPDQPAKEKIIETEPESHLTLEEKADNLPEIIHIPFEEAVKVVTLDGWEDDWIAHASYEPKTWGSLKEPKVDFVYLCTCIFGHHQFLLIYVRGEWVRGGISED